VSPSAPVAALCLLVVLHGVACARRVPHPDAAASRTVSDAAVPSRPRPFAGSASPEAGEGPLTAREMQRVRRMSPVPPPPPDPTNRAADRPEAAALGRRIFHDATLSVDGTVSCAGCHDPNRVFADGLPRAVARGLVGRRNTPSLVGAGWFRWQTWDGSADSLWAQPLLAWENPREHGLSRSALAARLRQGYGPALRAALGPGRGDGDLAVIADAAKALGAYVRTLMPGPAPFDRWVAGDARAMSPEAVRGLALFLRVGCVRCHSGAMFSDGDFHAVRFPDAPEAGADTGRTEGATRARAHPLRSDGPYSDAPAEAFPPPVATDEDLGRFRTPTLRGVALTAPYGHAGTLATLEDVVRLYAQGGLPPEDTRARGERDVFAEPFPARDEDVSALVAFLRALTPDAPVAETPPHPDRALRR
jgi:cytochrome c peroxidase